MRPPVFEVNNVSVEPEDATTRYAGIAPNQVLYDNSVVWMDASGRETSRVSILDAFLASDYAPYFVGHAKLMLAGGNHDLIHANSVDVIDSPQECWNDSIKVG